MPRSPGCTGRGVVCRRSAGSRRWPGGWSYSLLGPALTRRPPRSCSPSPHRGGGGGEGSEQPPTPRLRAVLDRTQPLTPPPGPLPEAERGSRTVADSTRALLSRAAATLHACVPAAVADLLPLADRPVELQPCLCDIWHDHVQFTGDAVSGVIDYGAMKVDHPAVDLARLLGDLVGDDPERVRFGVEAYRQAGGSPAVTVELVELLDRTGLVGAVVNWVRRLTDRAAPPADPTAATARLGRLLDRLDRVGRSAGR
ncbi:MAG: phosphotransferase [Gemmataceae bacterium]